MRLKSRATGIPGRRFRNALVSDGIHLEKFNAYKNKEIASDTKRYQSDNFKEVGDVKYMSLIQITGTGGNYNRRMDKVLQMKLIIYKKDGIPSNTAVIKHIY